MKTRQGLRWLVMALVAAATIINYIDRSALAVMWPGIADELGLDKRDYANIITVFLVGYAIGQSLFGKIFDALGTRVGFLLSIALWSVSIGLHFVARTALSFALFRALLGVGEAGNWPGATKAIAEWFPVRERALGQGIFGAGASLGSIVAPPLVAFLYAFVGWKTTFILIGALGFIWVVPWLIVYKSGPGEHPWVSAEERAYILGGQSHGQAGTPADDYVPTTTQLLGHRQSWGVIAARFFIDPVWWLFVGWLPLYLNEKFGFDVKQIGLFGWVPYVGAAIGALGGGWLCGRLLQRGWTVDRARKTVIALGLVVMFPALLLTAVVETPLAAVLSIAVILFGFQAAITNIQTLPSDFFSGRTVGSLAGISGTAAVLGVIGCMQLVPVLTAGGNYTPFFVLGAALVPLVFLAIWLGGPVARVRARHATAPHGAAPGTTLR
ncbi:ACS family hexuronate transporter-like MFS transporter [Pseudoduganella flava]|uniref:MFS transporter n=1 Tax=Pseudoduganella flava TaxID=871742 RepID=A0A562Q0K4_9BURK|nr:MFS transporter [Pseudoduganella flava]QGZ38266.1 MFS transporter [Pseudoduganella flava]TWI50197.1 ACS family hexuronate transporter-like MFS transporter [Pseudoduganella flava]